MTDLSTLDAAQKRALLAQKLKAAQPDQGQPRHAPLSLAQQRLWFIDQMQPGQPVYTIAAALRLEGALDPDRLARALDQVRARHEALRTRFEDRDGTPLQVIDPAAPMPLSRADLRAQPEQIEPRLQGFVAESFDLTRGPLARCLLLRTGAQSHILALAAHHIIADYRSLQVIIEEAAACYQGQADLLPPLRAQYADYALAQRARLADLEGQLDYWRRSLDGLPALTDLPTDHPRPPRQTFAGGRFRFSLSPDLSRRIESRARDQGTTPFALCLAAFHILHQRYSGSFDICIGTSISNRDRADWQGLVGYFVNTLALRARIAPQDRFADLLAQVRDGFHGAMRHHELPFEQVVDATVRARSLAHAPLFQSMFNLHEKQPEQIDLPGLTLSPYPLGGQSARFDLSLDLFHGPQFTGVLEYATGLFTPETAARMAADYTRILEAVTADPEAPLAAISLVTDEDRAEDAARNATARPVPEGGLAALIAAQAATQGEKPALIAGDQCLSHSALDAAAARLAGYLQPRIGAGDCVALCLPRTPDMVIAMLAVLRLGAAYVPLDPSHPPERLALILEDAAPDLLLLAGDSPVAPPCPVCDLAAEAAQIAAAPPCPAAPVAGEALAYTIFTSGTTGRPKGVPIRQDALVNLLCAMLDSPGIGPQDRLVAVTTPAFDIAALELFGPLLAGGTLILADPFDVIDGAALAQLIAQSGATMMQATPATWRLLCEEGWRAPAGFTLLCGGEALDPALAGQLLQGAGRLWNMYGPTETTIWSACGEIRPTDLEAGQIPLGQPIANTSLHVRDPNGQPCPPGVAGELMIGGIGLSPGYLHRDDLTAERFIPDPEDPAARLYRTGDLVRRLRDGTLLYLGRMDFQVKLRGFRIELGEIETILACDPAVEHAAVLMQGSGDATRLVAYCLSPDAPEDLIPRLRAAAQAALPDYMLPSEIRLLDRFPLNANGKLDRQRLPQSQPIGSTSSATAEPGGAPVTGTEALLVALWAELLESDAITRDSNFFAAGGHSLLAMRMVARLPFDGPRAAPLRLVFEAPRLQDFAARLDQEVPLRDTPPAPIPRQPDGAEPVLSHAQERQWTLCTLDPDSAAYNLPAALRLTGAVDRDRLARAFARLCARHALLRSAYPEVAGKPALRLNPEGAAALQCQEIAPETAEATLRAAAAQPFDLARGPLIRLGLYQTGPDAAVLLLVMHHIISDAHSVELVLRELMALYQALGRDPDHQPAPLALQYSDYAAWQRGQDHSDGLAYWHDHLRTAPPLLELPTDFQRPARQSFAGGSLDFAITGETALRLRRFAADQDATPFMALLSLYGAFLGRLGTTSDLVIGTPISQRPHPDLDALAGMFINTLALRLNCDSAQSPRALLQATRRCCIAGFAHQEAPFEQVVEALAPERSWSHNPVFQALFSWKQQEPAPAALGDGLAWAPYPLASSSSKMDIALAVLDHGDGFALRLEYARDLFRPETARHLALAFETLVASALATPDLPVAQLSLLHPEQEAQIAHWNATGQPQATGPVSLHGKISARAAQAGDRLAIRHASGDMSYRVLEQRSDRLAAHLQTLGIGKGDRVGIALGRSPDLITALVAVLKTGAAYVPLDPNYPPERIAHIRADATLHTVLSDRPDAEDMLDVPGFFDGPTGAGDDHGGPSLRPAPVEVGPEETAYLIYTSGSTGLPKGVILTHGNAHALIRWAESAFSQEQLAGMLGSTSVCFDLSVFEIFVTLSLGGTLMLVEDLFDLPDAPFRDQVTLINTVPTPMAELLKLGPLPASVRTVCLAGEPLPPALGARIYDTGQVDHVWNLYGPSEDTTYSTAMELPRDGAPFNIGWPITGTQAYVLDSAGQQLPPGLPGELFLTGAGVGQGYWNRPDLSAERFLTNPFDRDGQAPRMYRTGDRVRRTAEGSLDYMGRGDRQVKIRGFRIEPGEVETALTAIDGVTAAVVEGWRAADGPLRLTAWVETSRAEADLRRALGEALPGHCVPSLFVLLDSLPRLPNGKLDRNALPPPQAAAQQDAPAQSPPRPGIERQLAQIWEAILGRSGIGREENFFGLGGDSILAIQVVAAARDDLIPLSPRDLFQYPTLASLAEAAAGRPSLSGGGGPVTGPQALTPIQHWFLARDLPQAHHWNQALVLTPATALDPTLLQQAIEALADRHDGLRAQFEQTPSGWVQTYAAPGLAPILIETDGAVTAAAARMQAGFDLGRGPLWGAVLAQGADGSQRLALAAHHLIIDGVSWRILLEDLHRIYRALAAGDPLPRHRRSTSPGTWAEMLASSDLLAAEAPYWAAIPEAPALPLDHPPGTKAAQPAARHDTRIDGELSAKLLDGAPAAYPIKTEELLVAALYLALRDWTGQDALGLELESHGRADLSDRIDLSRTVGWLTGLYPVHLAGPAHSPTAEETLRLVKEALRAVPHDGIGYGVLRYLTGALPPRRPPGLRFNYLGRSGAQFGPDSPFAPAPESAGPAQAPDTPRDTVLELNARADDTGLRLGWNFSPQDLAPATVARLAERFCHHLEQLVGHCLAGDGTGFTPSDFPDMDFDQDDLDDLLDIL